MDVAQLTTSVWTALQPFLPLIASKGAEELGRRAVGELWETVRRKLSTKPASREALEDLLHSPQDADLQAQFRAQLKKALAEDPTFAASLAALLDVAGVEYSAYLEGDGAIAQGPGAKAVGKGGVMIEGNVSDSTIVTGDKNRVEK